MDENMSELRDGIAQAAAIDTIMLWYLRLAMAEWHWRGISESRLQNDLRQRYGYPNRPVVA